jgi:hypothetical protein
MGHGQTNNQRKKETKVRVPKPVTLVSNEFQKKRKEKKRKKE